MHACGYVFVWVHTLCAGECAHVHVFVGWGIFLDHSLFCFETRSFKEPRMHWFHKAQGSTCLHRPSSGITDPHHHALLFTWLLEIWTQSLMLIQQTFHHPSPLLSSPSNSFVQTISTLILKQGKIPMIKSVDTDMYEHKCKIPKKLFSNCFSFVFDKNGRLFSKKKSLNSCFNVC